MTNQEPEHITKMRGLLLKGHTLRSAARVLGIGEKKAYHEAAKYQIKAHVEVIKKAKNPLYIPEFSSPRPERKSWDDTSILRLANLRSAGLTAAQIALELDRSISSVKDKIRRMVESGVLDDNQVGHKGAFDPAVSGMRHCLICRMDFASPNRRQVQICTPCKQSESFRNFA
jgi:DNA-binding CsgD family transcriptional regulator